MALSATYPEDLAKMLATYMKDPVHVRLSQDCQVRKLLTLSREIPVLFRCPFTHADLNCEVLSTLTNTHELIEFDCTSDYK